MFGGSPIKEAVRQLTVAFESTLPADDVDIAREYLSHNERGIAYEHLCSQLAEFQIPISQSSYEQIVAVGTQMRLPPTNWEQLAKLVVNN